MDVDERFNSIYDETFRDLMGYCVIHARRLSDVEDLLQNTYARFYRILRRRGIQEIQEPKAYLMTLLKHELAGHYRFRLGRREVSLEELGEPETAEPLPTLEELCENRLSAAEVWALIRREPEPSCRAFILFYGYGMRIGEIARALGMTEAAVKNRLLRTRNRIRTELQED